MIIFLLFLTVVLSTVRNILSKNISDLPFGTKRFFYAQSVLFISGGITLVFAGGNVFENITGETVFYSVLYSLLLLLSQYFYTMSLKSGNIGICSTVYSLGFIFPTMSGNLFWNEPLTLWNIFGIILVVPTVIISGLGSVDVRCRKSGKGYIFPLVIAMIASGGLGIMQKIQQTSPHPEQKEFFVCFAFVLAGLVSYIVSFFAKDDSGKASDKKYVFSVLIGVCFGLANTLNTSLAGKLDSAVFFPILNISRIILSLISGIVFYKEKVSKKDVVVITLGVISIVLITVL